MNTENKELAGLLEPVAELAELAGEKILAVYNSDEFSVEEKADKSPLTAADMASHHAIVDGLSALTPDIPILSEESASLPYAERSAWQRYWLVDPLDGTREFIKRNGEFTVNIALIEAGIAVLSVVHVPVTGVSYLACHGQGAFKQEAGGKRRAIRARKLYFFENTRAIFHLVAGRTYKLSHKVTGLPIINSMPRSHLMAESF